jgi:hypothetical protein
MPVGGEAVERACHADDGVEDEWVGDEVVVLDHFTLLVALGGGRQSAAAEGDPLGIEVAPEPERAKRGVSGGF